MLPLTIPGVFADLSGVEVNDYDPQFRKKTPVSGVFGEGTAALWCDIIKAVDSEVLGVYTRDYYAGKPCFTRHAFGSGSVYYLGCDLDEAAMERLAVYLCRVNGIDIPAGAQKGVEIVPATDGAREALFILNHNDHTVVVPVNGSYIDLLKEEAVHSQIVLAPYDVAVLKQEDDENRRKPD